MLMGPRDEAIVARVAAAVRSHGRTSFWWDGDPAMATVHEDLWSLYSAGKDLLAVVWIRPATRDVRMPVQVRDGYFAWGRYALGGVTIRTLLEIMWWRSDRAAR